MSRRTTTATPTATAAAADSCDLPPLANVEQVAAYLNCSTKTVRRMISAGRLRGARRLIPSGGSRILVPRASVTAMVDAATPVGYR